MNKYEVAVKEVHAAIYEVEAASPEEAKQVAMNLIVEGETSDLLEYCHTLEPEYWEVVELE